MMDCLVHGSRRFIYLPQFTGERIVYKDSRKIAPRTIALRETARQQLARLTTAPEKLPPGQLPP